MTDIPAGYMVSITSWENDADNYATKTLTGLTADEARFYIKFASLFESSNSGHSPTDHNGNIKLGNLDCQIDVFETINAALSQFKAEGNTIPSKWDITHPYNKDYSTDPGFYFDLIWDLIGIWNDGEYYRVFDSFEVHRVETAVLDVTDDFKK